MDAEPSGLEVEVWYRCPDTETLWAFAQHLPPPADGSDRVPPEEGRRNIARTWEHIQDEPDAEPWHDAMLYGFAQAGYDIASATAAGIDVAIYAVRVQPLDAEFLPPAPALTALLRQEEHRG